jgi:hypothetical protein
MGIELWSRRNPGRHFGPTESPDEGPRVRLGSGQGTWLLVQRRPWDGSQATLVADITAVLGADQCRFGQWSVGSAAGLALADLSARGIVHILAFGPLPAASEAPGLIQAPALDELLNSADARRRLWTALRSAKAR